MIADASGTQPDALRIAADQKFFHAGLARTDAVAHGRNSYEGGQQAIQRRRLILTRGVAGLVQDPRNPNAMFWNPAGAPLQLAWRALGLSGGALAVIGGTDVFGLFLELGYDVFYLTRVPNVRLPGGRPLFPSVPQRTPHDLLASRGLKDDPARILDAATGATLVTWRR